VIGPFIVNAPTSTLKSPGVGVGVVGELDQHNLNEPCGPAVSVPNAYTSYGADDSTAFSSVTTLN
jgi:hypothetical protein